jgi:hypothetical protein
LAAFLSPWSAPVAFIVLVMAVAGTFVLIAGVPLRQPGASTPKAPD